MDKIDKLIEDKNNICIIGHVRPDGDCIGSTMGLYNYILDNYPQKHAQVYLEAYDKTFNYINGNDTVDFTSDKDIQYDIAFSLDISSIDRMGAFYKYYESAITTVCIDHHVSNNGFGKDNYVVPEASSCSEVLYTLMDDEKISKNTAEALYTGIVCDSGVFKYQATTADTMNIAGKLINKGINFTRIIDEAFYEKTYLQNQILGRALLKSELALDGRAIFSVVTLSEMEFYGISTFDIGGIVEQLRLTTGVECAIFLHETASLNYKVSMRSREIVDVSKIAVLFGGGGHKRAAGCNMLGTVYDVLNNVLKLVEQQLETNRNV